MGEPTSQTLQSVQQYLKEHFPDDLEIIREFLRQPSISYTGEGIQETAQLLVTMIQELGGSARIVPTEGHPVVFGKLDQGAPHTVLVYGMYDVMPAEEPDWSVDPWAAEIKELPGQGPSIVARGAVNTKGPMAGFFRAVAGYQAAAGKLPVNLLFALEGEEEMGSRHFVPFVEEHLDELKQADTVLFPFFSENEAGIPYMTLGTKGILYFELECQGGQWGGPTQRGVHGSYNAWVANPVWRLVQAMSSFVDEDETIRIDGFFDDVAELPADEVEVIRQQVAAGRMDETVFMESDHIMQFKQNLRGTALWERLFSQPQLNIDGIVGGYTGEGTKTLLPHRALAKMDVRMVPHMDPDRVEACIRKHLDAHGFGDITMRVYNKYPWSKLSLQEQGVQTMLKAYKDMGKEPVVWPLNPGSAPYYVFENILGIPYVTGGLGHGHRQHSNDEYCTVAGLLDFELSMAQWLHDYADAAEGGAVNGR